MAVGDGRPRRRGRPAGHPRFVERRAGISRQVERLRAGGGFRLPTEAEWEFAARAAGSPNGASSNDAFGLAGPRAVGQGKPNALGLFDLAGNVWEWCSSLSRPYPYDSADGRESLSEPGLRVLRGGGYADPKEWVSPPPATPTVRSGAFPGTGCESRAGPARSVSSV